MTTLSERYVWAVLRDVPEAQRADLEPEIRALVADAIEATNAHDPAAADPERQALVELGDPEVLAGRYVGRRSYLIGPLLYREWRGLVMALVPTVPPIVGTVVLAADLVSGRTVGEAIVSGLTTAFGVALQVLFWVTLVFAILDRAGTTDAIPGRGWSPDDLPETPVPERLGAVELVLSLIASVFVAAFIVWQQVASPIDSGDGPTTLLDPALWSFWLPWFLVVTVAEIVFTFALYRRGRWTWAMAVVNAVLGAAFAIPAIWLLQTGQLFNPAAVEAIDAAIQDAGAGTWLPVTVTIACVAIAVIVIWDAVDGFRKAYLNTRRIGTTVAV